MRGMKRFVAVLVFSMLLLMILGLTNAAEANPDLGVIMAMPEEQVQYTIISVNGTLWAKIDGTYPLSILTEEEGAPSCVPDELPMVYPTPPDTTNIHVYVEDTELGWSDYPYDTHHTAIGDWNMIYCVIDPVFGQFVLKIHYEHPLERVNGSYIFLYDLNISPYLSPWSPNSTAQFTVRMEAKVSNLQAYTTETDNIWNPIGFIENQEDTAQVITLQMFSEYDEPLAGDLVIMFSDSDGTSSDNLPFWLVLSLLAVGVGVVLATLFFIKKKARIQHADKTKRDQSFTRNRGDTVAA
jgi:hypothetical protein